MPTLVSTGLPTYYANGRKLVRLSDGTLYCVYHRTEAARWQIYVKKSTDGGSTWTDETRISTYAGMESYHQVIPSIAVDSSDHLHVVWHGMATGFTTKYQVWHNKYDGSWAGPVRISDYAGMQNDHQRYPSIAVDGSDNLHVVWDGQATDFWEANQVWYNKYDGSWAGPVRISDFTDMDLYEQAYAAIAIDSNDYLHVVWHGKADGFTTENQVWYNKYDGSWAGPVRISTAAGMNTQPNGAPSIAIDSNDYIHVVWYGEADGFPINSQVWYNKYDGSWAGPVRISDYAGMQNYGQSSPTIAIDASDNVHVAWYGKATGYTDTNKIWYAKYITSWATPEVLQPTGENTYPNLRWSLYPSDNIPYDGVDYVFTEAGANIYWDKKDDPFPPEITTPTVTTDPATEIT